MTIADWLNQATTTLTAAGVETARLDALVLLQHILRKDKAWLLAHDDHVLPIQDESWLNQALGQRAEQYPLAYITGHKEFYGRDFMVSSATLIPRPETELLLHMLATLGLPDAAHVLDVGTGSGIIAITAKLEHAQWRVEARDIDSEALVVASQNAHKLHAAVTFTIGDLLGGTANTIRYHAIVANLPYVAPDASVSPETAFEPQHALYADDDGLALITKLIVQAPNHLLPRGFLLLEAEPDQMPRIIELAANNGFSVHARQDFSIALQLNI